MEQSKKQQEKGRFKRTGAGQFIPLKEITTKKQRAKTLAVQVKAALGGSVIAVPEKDKVKAPPKLTKQQVLGQQIGDKIHSHIGEYDKSLRSYLKELEQAERDTLLACRSRLEWHRDEARKAVDEGDYTGEDTAAMADAAKSNISAKYSKILTIINAMLSRFSDTNPVECDFSQCATVTDMVAVARAASGKNSNRGKGKVALNATGFDSWNKKMLRVVDMRLFEKRNPTPDDIEKRDAQQARLERHIQNTLEYAVKVASKSTNFRFPVREMLALIAAPSPATGKRKHLKLAA